MNVEIITLFPELFKPLLSNTLFGKAVTDGKLSITLTQLRDFAPEPHRHVDDTPYGGGPGMILKPEPLAAAIETAKERLPQAKVVLPTPAGTVFTQSVASKLSQNDSLIFICGRYEGIDQRIIETYVDYELSLGDYILMGGELPTMAILETIARLLPGVLGNNDSLTLESFSQEKKPLLEAPQYTRPRNFQGREVPEVLLSGDHQKISEWRMKQSENITRKRRPDLPIKDN